jgi:hypothetical protein
MPNEVCAPIHDRMPVVVDPANYAKWLGEEAADPVRMLSLLKPFLAEQMECYHPPRPLLQGALGTPRGHQRFNRRFRKRTAPRSSRGAVQCPVL